MGPLAGVRVIELAELGLKPDEIAGYREASVIG